MPLSLRNSHSSDLQVMTLNLRFGLAQDGPNNWARRSAAYPDLLGDYPCDFFAFQEANDFQITFLRHILKNYNTIGQRQPAPDYWQNNVIFYHKRWRCLHYQHFYLSDTPDIPSQFSGSRWPRQCTLGTFVCKQRQITVIDTHFDFKAEVQQRSAILICKRLQELAPSWPVVLMGDFNAGPQSACLAVFTAPENGFNIALHPSPNGTHHGFKGSEAEGRTIDWVLYQGAITVVAAQVITNRYCGYFPSDHYPLTVGFKWP